MNYVKGTVNVCICDKCSKEFPIFEYDSETDVDTVGLWSATHCDEKILMLTNLNIDEWQQLNSGSLKTLPKRLWRDPNDAKYRFSHIIRVDTPETPTAESSFSEFRNLYKNPVVVYSCICCEAGEATIKKEITLDDFLKEGGSILTL